MNKRMLLLTALAIILMTAVIRILNHETGLYNFAPVAAMGLFSGAVIRDRRYAFLVAILTQFLGDLYFQFFTNYPGFYGIEQVFVYGGLLAVTLLGTSIRQPKALRVLGYSIAGSLLFFAVSNFGVWVSIESSGKDLFGYGHGLTGLGNTFIAGIPFLKNSIIGDLIGAAVLFGAYQLVTRKSLAVSKA